MPGARSVSSRFVRSEAGATWPMTGSSSRRARRSSMSIFTIIAGTNHGGLRNARRRSAPASSAPRVLVLLDQPCASCPGCRRPSPHRRRGVRPTPARGRLLPASRLAPRRRRLRPIGPDGTGLSARRHGRGRRPGCGFRSEARRRAGSDGRGGGRDHGRHEQRGGRRTTPPTAAPRGRGGREAATRWLAAGPLAPAARARRLAPRLVSARQAVASPAKQQRRRHGTGDQKHRGQSHVERGPGRPLRAAFRASFLVNRRPPDRRFSSLMSW